jgi:WD40 repeat protein
MRIIVTLTLIVFLAACGGNAPNTPATSNSPTSGNVPNTSEPSATQVVPVKLSEEDVKKALQGADPVCESAFSTPITGGIPTAPFIALVNRGAKWEHEVKLDVLDIGDQSNQQSLTLVCIQEKKQAEGTQWFIRLVDNAKGKVIGMAFFLSGDPSIETSKWLGFIQKNSVLTLDKQLGTISLSDKNLAWGIEVETDSPAVIWDTQTREVVHVLSNGPDCCASDVVFSPDGNSLATLNNSVAFWDVATGKLLRSANVTLGLPSSATFSADGKAVIIAGVDDVVILDAATGKEIRILKGQNGNNWSVTMSPDAKYIAAGGSFNAIELWDAASGKLLREFGEKKKMIMRVAFSHDSNILASVSYEGQTIDLWNAATGETVQTLRGHTETVSDIAFSPDGRYLASASWDGSVKLWDVKSWQITHTYTSISGISSIAFSPNSKTLAAGTQFGGFGGMVVLWPVN